MGEIAVPLPVEDEGTDVDVEVEVECVDGDDLVDEVPDVDVLELDDDTTGATF